MGFASLAFVAFFTTSALLWRFLPARLRLPALLALSWGYLYSWGGASLAVLLTMTALTYLAGLAVGKSRKKPVRLAALGLGILCSAGAVFLYKAVQLAAPGVSLFAAVGAAFYGLQAASYLADVYCGRCAAQKNLLHYALYLAFFPRVLSGPIGRAEAFFAQLHPAAARRADGREVQAGLWLMLWGYLEKFALADTLGLFVDTVYGAPDVYGGAALALATAAFAVSLYGDFSGYSHIAIGAAQVLGFQLSENFRRPYLAQSLTEFWQRWHISLSGWLREYIYIPLGGSRCSKARRAFNLMATFLVSGLWHGVGWQYIFWGALHGTYQIMEKLLPKQTLAPARHWPVRLLRRVVVFLLVDFAWLFFRAESLPAAFAILKRMGDAPLFAQLTDGTLFAIEGLGPWAWGAVLGVLVLFAAVSLAVEHGAKPRAWLLNRPAVFRMAATACLAALVLLFAVRGVGGEAAGFYYAQF